MTISVSYPLPQRTRRFINQTALLRATEDLVTTGLGGLRQIVVSGITFGGTTAATVEAAHRLGESRFPDGVFYYEMSDDLDQAETGTEVVSDLLFALGASELPTRPKALRGQFHARTTKMSYLFVLDGVLSESQTRLLELGPGGSLIITVEAGRPVTSLGRPDCAYWPLADLNTADALQIFAGMVGADRVGAEPEAARVVVELCDRLPGVLTVVASDIRRSAGAPTPIADMVERLRDEQRRPASRVASIAFSVAYRRLAETVQKCYIALGLDSHGGVVSVNSLAVAANVDRGAAAEALVELVAGHLVYRCLGGRYRSRRIVRAHARDIDTRTAEQRRAAEERLVKYYDERIIAADVLLAPKRPWRRLLWPDLLVPRQHFRNEADARQWLRAERPAIRAAFESAYKDERFDLVIRWCVHLWPFHEKEKDIESLILLHKTGVCAAEQLGWRDATSLLHAQVGFAYYWQYELHRAATAFGAAFFMADHSQLKASAQEGLGLAFLELGTDDSASAAFAMNRALALLIGDSRRITLAEFHWAKSLEPAQALPLLRRVGREFASMESDETENEAKASYWMGRMLIHSDDLDAAEAELERALVVMQERSRPFDTGQIRFALGEVARGRGDSATAIGHYREALTLFSYIDFPEPMRRTRAMLAELEPS